MNNFHDRSPDISRQVSSPSNLSEEVSAAPGLKQPAKPQVAIFVTHGMGQQVPFETIDSVVEGLTQAATRNDASVTSIRAQLVQIGEIKTQRAQFDMRDSKGNDVEVHVYEGYWAPITEGQVTLRDVMSFLLGAGLNGLWNSRSPFKRWIFGKPVTFGRQHWAALKLLVTLLVLFSLVVLNAFTAIVSGDKLIPHNATFTATTFGALTTTVGIYVIFSLIFGGSLYLATWYSRRLKPPKNCPMWLGANRVLQALMWAWIGLTLIAAILMILISAGCLPPVQYTSAFLTKLWLPIWFFLLVTSWVVRRVIVEYMGDVAAYVDSHTLDRFNDIRTRIKANVFNMAKAVYSSEPKYERVAMVGHSLGSVITYDTLNALINHDQLNGGTLEVIGRTKLLLTFGSPLDKVAFIFASQIDKATATREALAATMQPLIQKYVPFRGIKWINIWSRRDIVSGELEFYDDKDDKDYSTGKVNNLIDDDALVPLAAHIEYWNNPTLFDQLYENL